MSGSECVGWGVSKVQGADLPPTRLTAFADLPTRGR